MAVREVIIPYCPRPQFEAYHDRKQRFAKIVAHRRFGKTVGCINDKIRQAITNPRQFPPPRYSYIAPTYSQAKDVAWGYLKFYCSAIPGLKVAESELYVEFPHNRARFRLYGADNYDRLRGTYNDDVTIDEPALMDPRAWPEVIRPTLADFNGGATFIGTPAGKDWFYRVDKDENGIELPEWFRLVLRASETGVIPPLELESLRAGMSADQYAREFECSFEAAVVGAYFGSLMSDAATEGRIGLVARDPLLPLRAWVDIGGAGAKADAFTIWITQWVNQEIRILDYYESVGQVLATHVNWLRSKKYKDAVIYLPHDGANTNEVTGLTYAQHMYDAGFEVEVIGNQGKGAAAMRIEALRRIMPRCSWNEATTGAGRAAISHYHEKRDDGRGIGLGPEHDWSSHAADALGMMAIVYEPQIDPQLSDFYDRGGYADSTRSSITGY